MITTPDALMAIARAIDGVAEALRELRQALPDPELKGVENALRAVAGILERDDDPC